ncbi:MAG: class I SAM-dependent methyltransferase [Tannerella sp.]|jgi:hypothetical protein|nr:class I SAM-dependent methyltransferase [Tannerella sp.]
MEMTERLKAFIKEHAEDDVLQLVLNASRYKDVDVRFAAGQIAARRRIKDKLPEWYANDGLIYPSSLAAEQCSSGQTAHYKQRFVGREDVVCDLTGGLGVDTYFFSLKAQSLTYVEYDVSYCEAAAYNMKQLGVKNVHILNENAVELLTKNPEKLSGINVFYLDPARRGSGNERRFALQDCEPDLTKLWPLLCNGRCKVIAKLSPMLDIKQLLSQLTGIGEVHVVSVRNDCKELLIVADTSCTQRYGAMPDSGPDVRICCVNFTTSGEEQSFPFSYGEEKAAVAVFAGEVGHYLYEPNASVLKAGAYKTVSSRYGLKKLHVSSHLYTSDTYLPSFAGRIFEVCRVYKFDNRLCRSLSTRIPRANIAVRNFSLSADELRERTRIVDGGDVYLFASTLSDQTKVLIECRKIDLPS